MNNLDQPTCFDPSKFHISAGHHHEKKVLWINFDYDRALIQMLKKHTKARWSKVQKRWYLYDSRYNRKICGLKIRPVGKEVLSKIAKVNQAEFERYQNMIRLKGYSQSTLKTYAVEFAQLLYVLKDYPVQNLSPKRLQCYFLYCTKKLKLSENQIHSRINAVKFYYEKVLHREKMFFDIPRPKKQLALPKTLSIIEVKRLFGVTQNLKHRLMLKLCYGLGLRVSEIVNLRVEDIDKDRMQVFIERAKGKKDRYVSLPETILKELREYYKTYCPKEYLFEGQYGGITPKEVPSRSLRMLKQKPE